MSTYAIKADKFFLPAGPQLGGFLMVEDGVFGTWQADEPACEIKDYSGTWIAPGMVDTHIHGFYNHATTDNDAEGINISSTELARRTKSADLSSAVLVFRVSTWRVRSLP